MRYSTEKRYSESRAFGSAAGTMGNNGYLVAPRIAYVEDYAGPRYVPQTNPGNFVVGPYTNQSPDFGPAPFGPTKVKFADFAVYSVADASAPVFVYTQRVRAFSGKRPLTDFARAFAEAYSKANAPTP